MQCGFVRLEAINFPLHRRDACELHVQVGAISFNLLTYSLWRRSHHLPGPLDVIEFALHPGHLRDDTFEVSGKHSDGTVLAGVAMGAYLPITIGSMTGRRRTLLAFHRGSVTGKTKHISCMNERSVGFLTKGVILVEI